MNVKCHIVITNTTIRNRYFIIVTFRYMIMYILNVWVVRKFYR